ncbi:MAG: hypothetical protein N0C84_07805 [Candidatus Thiodiazotropha taylori]|uniref:Uncharacterized protein n=1 Tax=Candidatus Thiodiazotropha taylori TaxID=2792791 RepID=A0A9E4KD97_9GAMM|nr:hypothetical protein [Candidatus Thiodiazotropha taylori]MCW4256356.1 hypothetical protein [Candidatus Thiodiazotropha taylori]
MSKLVGFLSEQELVNEFLQGIHSGISPWGAAATEFDYQSGRTDVIAIGADNQLVAFEAKLTRWKVAVHQAFKNTCFAEESYVVLPKSIAERAYSQCEEFSKRRVGLCYVENSDIVILIQAPRVSPLNMWLNAKAANHIRDNREQLH